MIGHDLGHAQRYTNGNGLTIMRAECECKLTLYATTLPALWAAHDVHRGVVRALAMGRHPSQREGS